MKTGRFSVLALVAVLALLLSGGTMAMAQVPQPPDSGAMLAPEAGGGPGPVETGFTYQGQLKGPSGPVNGACDFQFSLWDRGGTGTPPSGGLQVGATETQTGVAVANGLFTAVLNAAKQFGDDAFREARWLQIAVRCPSNTGTYTALTPRQALWAAPFAMGLRPGTRILGGEYQTLKVQNNSTLTGNPAAVTGEMLNAADGVGVYGSNTNHDTGSTGIGVWGRSYSLAGAGVKGTGLNGSTGVKAVGTGTGVEQAALYAENTNPKATEPAGVAIYGKNNGGDAAIVAQNVGGGDAYRAVNAAGTSVIWRVTSNGQMLASAVQIYGGGDLAEHFLTGEAVGPGTLMVIDEEHPGRLKPSMAAYDTRVAGVVSGAGGVKPGVTLQQEGVMEGNAVVAIAGRVYVKADARQASIKPGDLLTSSDVPGHAMKAADRERAQGAVIGKAMTGLDGGEGLVMVLVSLQ